MGEGHGRTPLPTQEKQVSPAQLSPALICGHAKDGLAPANAESDLGQFPKSTHTPSAPGSNTVLNPFSYDIKVT